MHLLGPCKSSVTFKFWRLWDLTEQDHRSSLLTTIIFILLKLKYHFWDYGCAAQTIFNITLLRHTECSICTLLPQELEEASPPALCFVDISWARQRLLRKRWGEASSSSCGSRFSNFSQIVAKLVQIEHSGCLSRVILNIVCAG